MKKIKDPQNSVELKRTQKYKSRVCGPIQLPSPITPFPCLGHGNDIYPKSQGKMGIN